MVNKYNLKDILEDSYSDCKSTLELSSLDDRNQEMQFYLCGDRKLEVFNFDLIKDKVDKKSKSPDAIYVRGKNYYDNFFSHIITQDVNFYKTNFKELKC